MARAQKFAAKFKDIKIASDLTALAPDFKTKKDEFKDEYSGAYPTLRAAEKTFRNLVELVIPTEFISTPKIISRIKERDECIKKFEIKYRQDIESKGVNYNIIENITDLIGIRVICLYEMDIPFVESALISNFEMIDRTDKTSELVQYTDSFGYKGVHLDLKLHKNRRQFHEYKTLANLRFEVQIRSIVQDAWSEVDHRLKYKKQIPPSLQRRIFRLAALFELADQEFGYIKTETESLEKEAILKKKNGIEFEDISLNSFSFISIMNHYGKNILEPTATDGFVTLMRQMSPQLTARTFAEFMKSYDNFVCKYADDLREKGFPFNPFTHARHVLFRADQIVYRDMLYPRQRGRFVEWIKSGEIGVISIGEQPSVADL